MFLKLPFAVSFSVLYICIYMYINMYKFVHMYKTFKLFITQFQIFCICFSFSDMFY